MKPEGPLKDLDPLLEPPLGPGFARRVLHQARAQKRRQQLRNRLAILSVICGVLGFGVTTLVRAWLAKVDAPAVMSGSAGHTALAVENDRGAVAANAEHTVVETLIMRRGMREVSSGGDNALPGARAPGSAGAAAPSTERESQTLVIETPPPREASATAASDEAVQAEPQTPRRPAPLQPDAASDLQPSIRLP